MITSEVLKELTELLDNEGPEPWTPDYDGRLVYAGERRVCDIRGWGYYIGHGTIGQRMSEQEALRRQVNTTELIVTMRNNFRELIAMAELYLEYQDRLGDD